jgi:hypothetical protein
MSLLGNLNLDSVQHGWVIAGGQASMVFGALAVIGLLTYKKRWNWLWKEWLTTTDPKKIGVMYIVFALLMLLRGAVDAGMMRAQQAVSVGGNHGFLSPDLYRPWDNYDFLRWYGTDVWSNKLSCADADRVSRRSFSFSKCHQFLAICHGWNANKSLAFSRWLRRNWLAGISAIIRNCF